jgi:hypothetical protein
MSPSEDFINIADASHPNAGRIYDFLLGGNHNFEIDRKAAQQLLQIAPFMPKAMKLIRWFLGEAVRRLVEMGYGNFLDFASGLPTSDHIHQVAPKGTKVLYSDKDPVTVAYAREIIGDNPDIRYLQAKAENPEEVLESRDLVELFGKNRKMAIGFNGISYFLPDEKVAGFMKVMYGWAGKGSRLFLCEGDGTTVSEELKRFAEIYKNIGEPLHFRSLERIGELIQPWAVEDPGFRPLEEWIDMGSGTQDDVKKTFAGGGFIGAILVKK